MSDQAIVDQELAQRLVDRAKAEGVKLTGPGGLLGDLTKRVLEAGLEGEMDSHLGYASRAFRVMTAVAYYAGLRPSEVVMLRVRSTVLAAEGWARLEVTEADISFDEPGEPETGPRSVPIPPLLVTMLRDWIEQNNLTDPDRLLFRTRNDTRPSGSNWIRAWHRALESVGQKPLRVYDCRHAAATTWLGAGMPLAETARRLGHSVETLVSTYVGALDDEEHIANLRVDTILG